MFSSKEELKYYNIEFNKNLWYNKLVKVNMKNRNKKTGMPVSVFFILYKTSLKLAKDAVKKTLSNKSVSDIEKNLFYTIFITKY